MIKISVILAGIAVAGLMSWQVAANRPATDCTIKVSIPGERQVVQRIDCAASLNWVEWVSGKSRSPQFHFLDLLELLFGNKSNQPSSSGLNTNNLLTHSFFR
ncbi:hypothetical protein A28LD_0973 [Idiomarina sp. A28L]|uniref:hypothetical protein n=1 Tax=Idiomarina sp. A28L TaxID=1036674 RepID=UPI0002138B25|nr:hypothetical protein [Idiomarina sp. A28L]EGN75360.1 hypothetical protein A28LD_0973 [Idiomarina sp. A28L]